ncbi:MAG: hypothetical protein QNJ47_05655 [Nostocaceae cyanobacterium]|nr:hypothetical protein [Nostocaceae cyanobacterium]
MPCVELPVIYSFDYSSFSKPELEQKAQKTLSNFLGFVRQTFDGLLECGKALQDIYYDCIANCPKGKKLFEQWLASDDFGASRYIAKAAIEIYNWFSKLPKRVQRLVRQNVQFWSVAALRQLTKVSHDLLKELVRNGKKTAAQVKEAREQGEGRKGEDSSPLPQLAPGMRILVTSDDNGWSGEHGIIISKWEGNDKESWWVLLDSVVAQGLTTKHLYKPQQLKAEATAKATSKLGNQKLFTSTEVESKIAEALAQRDREKAEEELGRFVEIRDAALKAAEEELFAARQHAQNMAQAKEKLVQQLIEKEQELEKVRHLQTRNQQLEQRVEELEKSLVNATVNEWGNTFTKQAAKVVNSELEKTIKDIVGG